MELRSSDGRIAVSVDPERGGRVAQIRIGGVGLLIGHDDVPDTARAADGSVPATAWGSYPMVPWAGRIRHGRFTFDGREHRLPINMGDHAIHGTGFTSAWDVVDETSSSVRLELRLPTDERWPFGGIAGQAITVDDDGVELVMDVTATTRPFPVSFGWHPWFRKPDRIGFSPSAMYERDEAGIAVDHLVEVPPGPWDDCFRNTSPVDLVVGGIRLRLISDCVDWVLYDEPAHATCVEPQTGPPDAPTIAPRILLPGHTHRARFRIDVG